MCKYSFEIGLIIYACNGERKLTNDKIKCKERFFKKNVFGVVTFEKELRIYEKLINFSKHNEVVQSQKVRMI